MTETNEDRAATGLDPAAEGLTLPDGIVLLEKVGSGRAATVYKARFQGETIALKAYKSNAASWYRKKLDKNIAVYEMMQNRALRKHAELIKYTAKPLRVVGQDGKASLCFLQEYIDGITLEQLGDRYGHIPGYLMRTGESIARVCEEHSIKGVDDFMKGVKLRQSASTWLPIMFDFKHIPSDKPQEVKPGLLQRFGLNKAPPVPAGFMGAWETLNRKLEKDLG